MPTQRELELAMAVERGMMHERQQVQLNQMILAEWRACAAEIFSKLAAGYIRGTSAQDDEAVLGPLAVRCVNAARILSMCHGVQLNWVQPPGIPGVPDPVKAPKPLVD